MSSWTTAWSTTTSRYQQNKDQHQGRLTQKDIDWIRPSHVVIVVVVELVVSSSSSSDCIGGRQKGKRAGKAIEAYVGLPIAGQAIDLLDTPGIGDTDVTPMKVLTLKPNDGDDGDNDDDDDDRGGDGGSSRRGPPSPPLSPSLSSVPHPLPAPASPSPRLSLAATSSWLAVRGGDAGGEEGGEEEAAPSPLPPLPPFSPPPCLPHPCSSPFSAPVSRRRAPPQRRRS